MAFEVSADPKRFEEAIAWFRERVPMTDAEYRAIAAVARARAFSVAGAAQLDLVQDVHAALVRALEQGTTLAAFQEEIGPKLSAAWGGDQPWRIETIFRTNLQLAYGAGRHRQQTDPAVLRARPWWKFSAVLDGRTSDICRECADVLLPASDPWWATHIPPLHHRCRSTKIALDAEEAKAEGITSTPPTISADEGFGGVPDLAGWHPDLAGVPGELVHEHARKLGELEAFGATKPPSHSHSE